MKRFALLTVACTLLAHPVLQAAELRVLLKEKQLKDVAALSIDNFQRELGRLLAARSHREARFITLPRKRLPLALENGDADILCGYIPEWLPGHFDWSIGFIDVADVIISEPRTPAPKAIEDLADKRVGTILGYAYPEVEKKLGKKFIRDDSFNAASNIQKLRAGRYDYAIMSASSLEFHKLTSDPPLPLNPPLYINNIKSQCAISRQGNITLQEINHVINEILNDGSYAKLLEQSPLR
ncbi:substrate-binding periplasmic protein [Parachitinimonas caeni]|uniref:Transporter substrate-binding domain-containing protein n=1 Tax=Parachitinimonas caeni TaxID=3031301 RepID=A0ABT7DS69_9NEIS|nr:transporter substrate-binding domain-containing protein [Parachitinimonas caeni]MDK2122913.1 transporter substrate-binding domain-containing protein [Parachitinimonas caeni]